VGACSRQRSSPGADLSWQVLAGVLRLAAENAGAGVGDTTSPEIAPRPSRIVYDVRAGGGRTERR
jgi:hypothetical protein